MITQIEIDGFKSFQKFKVELAPFQVIAGENGSGKSNLFDALQLLSRLATFDLLEAFQGLRGEADDLFMNHPGQGTGKRIAFAVEMLLDRDVEDDLGQLVALTYTRVRYELGIVIEANTGELDQLLIHHEALKVIPLEEDTWLAKHSALAAWGNVLPDEDPRVSPQDHNLLVTEGYIAPLAENARGERMFRVVSTYAFHPPSSPLLYHARSLPRTLLNQVKGASYVQISAVRAEMRSWQFVHLDPAALREPNSTVSRDMANLIPGILKIQVEREKASEQYVVKVTMSDNRIFPSQVLSDGTLRLLALSTLKNDPQLHSVLCLEEPEDGVSPSHIGRIARLLRQMATDLSDPSQLRAPLCQVLVTTHSPLLVSQPDVLNALLLAIVSTRLDDSSGRPMQVTIMFPAMTTEVLSHLGKISREEKAPGAYTANMISNYLDSQSLEGVREELDKGHSNLNQR